MSYIVCFLSFPVIVVLLLSASVNRIFKSSTTVFILAFAFHICISQNESQYVKQYTYSLVFLNLKSIHKNGFSITNSIIKIKSGSEVQDCFIVLLNM